MNGTQTRMILGSQGTLGNSGDIIGCHNWFLGDGGQDDLLSIIWQNINLAEVEKLWLI
jgi:hypothetical protein